MNEIISRRKTLINLGLMTAIGSLEKSLKGFHSCVTCNKSEDGFYFDDLGLIVQQDCDGGDTAQREGMYWLGLWMWKNDLGLGQFGKKRKLNFEQVLNYLEDGKTGKFRRHPTQTQNGFNLPGKTSRDQLVPLIASMGVNRDFIRLDRLRDRIRRNFYFVNKDSLIFFDEFIKRALDRDLQFKGMSDKVILDKAVDFRLDELNSKKDMDDVGDDLNLIVQLALAAVRRGDKIKAIRLRYSKKRPKNYGVYLTHYREAYPEDLSATKEIMIERINRGIKNHGWRPDCTNVQGVMKWYFREETGGNFGMVALYKPILDRYFSASIST